jgi:hypothetical protein
LNTSDGERKISNDSLFHIQFRVRKLGKQDAKTWGLEDDQLRPLSEEEEEKMKYVTTPAQVDGGAGTTLCTREFAERMGAKIIRRKVGVRATLANSSKDSIREYAVFVACVKGTDIHGNTAGREFIVHGQIMKNCAGGFILGSDDIAAHAIICKPDEGVVSMFRGDQTLIVPNIDWDLLKHWKKGESMFKILERTKNEMNTRSARAIYHALYVGEITTEKEDELATIPQIYANKVLMEYDKALADPEKYIQSITNELTVEKCVAMTAIADRYEIMRRKTKGVEINRIATDGDCMIVQPVLNEEWIAKKTGLTDAQEIRALLDQVALRVARNHTLKAVSKTVAASKEPRHRNNRQERKRKRIQKHSKKAREEFKRMQYVRIASAEM